MRASVGRPSLETDQPELLKTIVEIAMRGASAHQKRREDIYRSIKTLSELNECLTTDFGFTISRSATYYRLLPRCSRSNDAKKHINTVPVRLLRAKNDEHRAHVDTNFAASTIRHLEELSSFLGPNAVSFISQDDKARVPIGITAANKQSPMIMHVDYRVTLPDHDWVVANKHKLIPSVYAGISIQPNKCGDRSAVGYSGPTYIGIRYGTYVLLVQN